VEHSSAGNGLCVAIIPNLCSAVAFLISHGSGGKRVLCHCRTQAGESSLECFKESGGTAVNELFIAQRLKRSPDECRAKPFHFLAEIGFSRVIYFKPVVIESGQENTHCLPTSQPSLIYDQFHLGGIFIESASHKLKPEMENINNCVVKSFRTV